MKHRLWWYHFGSRRRGSMYNIQQWRSAHVSIIRNTERLGSFVGEWNTWYHRLLSITVTQQWKQMEEQAIYFSTALTLLDKGNVLVCLQRFWLSIHKSNGMLASCQTCCIKQSMTVDHMEDSYEWCTKLWETRNHTSGQYYEWNDRLFYHICDILRSFKQDHQDDVNRIKRKIKVLS